MVRVLLFIFFVTFAGMLAVWIAEQPGDVTLTWHDYLLESSVSMLIAIVLVCGVLCAFVFELVILIVRSPRLVTRFQRERMRERGYRFLTRGMVAVAAGDGKAAKRAVRTVEKSLIDRPLRLLLTAQAAQLEGDESKAQHSFREMLSEPESEFLGLRGLLVQSLREEDKNTALALVRRAFEINPRADWVLNNLIELETFAGNWKNADQSVLAAERAHQIKPANARRRRALLLFKLAQVALHDGEKKKASKLAGRSVRLRPGFIPAVILAAQILVEIGNVKRAKKLVIDAWKVKPHPELSRVLIEISEPLTVLGRMKVLEPLVSLHPGDQEGHLALASASLDASMWGTAREHLGRAAQGRPDQRLYRLMARLEEGENNNEAAARQWLLKASNASGEPSWQCGVCREVSDSWAFQCPFCDAIDSLEWGSSVNRDNDNAKQQRVPPTRASELLR